MIKKFSKVAATEENKNWENLIKRQTELHTEKDDTRTPFGRDYTRILHSLAYRRLKHKTQVFFDTTNDHICTRLEHVYHVESISHTIANNLGLNTELTKAISVGHDIGHAPFGHQGETILKILAKKYLKNSFYHEVNSLRFIDEIELLEDENRKYKNLNLTYAVRDGIVSHCGEKTENNIKPRIKYIDLNNYNKKGKYRPYTWEGCVVRISDKIAYLGRDFEDAKRLNFITREQFINYIKLADAHGCKILNNTTIIQKLITDLCNNSNIEDGLCFSSNIFSLINEMMKYNYEYILKLYIMNIMVKIQLKNLKINQYNILNYLKVSVNG